MRGKGFVRELVERAAARIALDFFIEPRRVEGVEPRTKARQFAGGEALDSFFDVFDGAHGHTIAFLSIAENSKNPGVSAGVLHFVFLSEIPGLRSGMKDAAPRPE